MSTQPERKLLVFATSALIGLGLLMVYSSSITARPSFADQRYLTRQLYFLAAGLVAAGVAACVPVAAWRRAATPLFIASALLLAVVLVPGVGTTRNGAQRWFSVGQYSVQPSELAKFALVLFLSHRLARERDAVLRFWSGWLPLAAPCVVVSGLVLFEPDFGTAMFLLAVAAIMLFVGGMPYAHALVAGMLATPVVAWLAWAQPYRVKRLLQFVEAWSDPNAASYHVQQSLVAFGSGGIWGTGLGRGWQKLGFLPEANTDFIFAVLGEELGLVGTLTVLLLWGALLVCGVRLARQVGVEPFVGFLCFGLTTQLGLQALLNVGVVTGVLPPKGISLPFLSAGGSNLVASLVSVGVILGVTQTKRRSRVEDQRTQAVGQTFLSVEQTSPTQTGHAA
jgi:cell division protein FtsW